MRDLVVSHSGNFAHFAFPFSRGSSNPGIEPTSPALEADSLPAEPQGKPSCLESSKYAFPHISPFHEVDFLIS